MKQDKSNFWLNKIRVLTLGLVLPLAGCLATGDPFGLKALNDSTAEMFGTYQAPTLAASPKPSGCADRDARCRVLDQTEAYLYQEARARRISWVQLVDTFYAERARQYPNSNDNNGAREWSSFQRMLAEQLDQGKISESQWVYYQEQKDAEMKSRVRQDAANSALIKQANQKKMVRQRNLWVVLRCQAGIQSEFMYL